jgi:protein gp37
MPCGGVEHRSFGRVSGGGGHTAASTWNSPRSWYRRTAAADKLKQVFCASLADVFDNAVVPAWRAELFALIRETPALERVLATKRTGNAVNMEQAVSGWPENVFCAPIIKEEHADRDVLKLLGARGPRFRFCRESRCWACRSATDHLRRDGARSAKLSHASGGYVLPVHGAFTDPPRLDWIIVGGESGKGARPCLKRPIASRPKRGSWRCCLRPG